MTPPLFVAIALAGGIGALARLVLDAVVRSRVPATVPLGTAIINVSGSLVLGLLVGLVTAETLPLEVQLVAGTGFLGGYTTFSTASVETVRLVQQGRVRAAASYALGTLVLSLAGAAFGLWLGSLIAR